MDETQQNPADNQVDSWADAEASFLAEKGIEQKPKEDAAGEPKDPNQPADNGNSDPAKTGNSTDETKKPEDPAKDVVENTEDDTAPYREARSIQREIEADRKQMRSDVKEKLYSDWTDDILDGDGDPIKTPADVMKHTNPLTGQPFTEEEATAWLFAAQKHKDQQRSEMNDRIEQISEVNIRVRDEADTIRTKYGKLLADLPELRKEIYADWKDTLTIDEQTGLIMNAPVSLERFFERALRPYAERAQELQAQSKANAEAAAKAKQQKTIENKQNQSDRQDVTSTGKGDVTDPEEKAWHDAAKQYYEG